MVVDAQVHERVREARVAAVLLHDDEGRGLLTAPVAARGLRGPEALDQPLYEREISRRLERRRERVHRLLADEDVPLRCVARARATPGPREAALAGVGRRSSLAVNDAELALPSPLVGGGQALHGLLRRQSLA